MKNNITKGILYLLFGGLCFTIMAVFVRLSGDLPTMQKALFRNIIAAIFAAYLLIKAKQKINLNKEKVGLLILRSLAGTCGILLNFYAYDHLLLSDATIIGKMSPFLAILLGYVFLKERVTRTQIYIIIGAFIGCLIVIRPSYNVISNVDSFIALGGSFCVALAYTFVRILGKKDISGPFVIFFFSAFSSLILLPFVIMTYQEMSMQQIIYLTLAGLAACGGQYGITNAYFNAPAKDISAFDYIQVVFAAIIGYFVLHQVIDFYNIIGYIIIILMGYLMYYYGKIHSK